MGGTVTCAKVGVLEHLRWRNLLIISDDICCSVLVLKARLYEMPGQAGHDRMRRSSRRDYVPPQDDVKRNVAG